MTPLIDPVCGMRVGESALRTDGYDTVAFCAEGCRRAFLADPSRYMDQQTSDEGHGAGPITGSDGCGCGHHAAGGLTAGAQRSGHHGCGHHHRDRPGA